MPKVHVLDREDRWDRNNEDEYLWWPRVLWMDPGVVSGVAIVWFDPKALIDRSKTVKMLLAYSELFLHGPENGATGQIAHYLKLRQTLDEEPGLATGIESFTPRQLNQSWEFYAPMRIRAGLEYPLSRTKPLGSDVVGKGVPLHTQSPSEAITTFSNDRLRALNMYTPGPDHVNDAKRHTLLHIRKMVGDLDRFKDMHGYEEGWFGR